MAYNPFLNKIWGGIQALLERQAKKSPKTWVSG